MGYTIGITGGIGSGKSTVAEVLSAFGFLIIDFDQISRDLRNDPIIKSKLSLIYRTTDLSRQREIFYKNSKVKKRVINFIGPKILREAKRRSKNRSVVFWDIPLLFESNLQNDVNEAWIVTSLKHLRISRVLKRNKNYTKKLVLEVMKHQLSDKNKIKLAKTVRHEIIKNNLGKAQLKKIVSNLIEDRGLKSSQDT